MHSARHYTRYYGMKDKNDICDNTNPLYLFSNLGF